MTSVCLCWLLTPVSGAPLGFTNHTRNLTLPGHPGVTFYSKRGLSPTTSSGQAGMAPPNMEVDAIFQSDGITDASVNAGVWDFASYEVFMVNYMGLGMGELVLHSGHIGEITSNGITFKAQGLGLVAAAQQQVGEVTVPTCRARNLGDARCQVDLTPFTFAGTLSAVASLTQMTVSTVQADGYFNNGKITFTSGAANGVSMEISAHASNVIVLRQPLPFLPSPGDSYSIIAGCDRTAGQCFGKFNNKINFQGEDTVPMVDTVNQVTPP